MLPVKVGSRIENLRCNPKWDKNPISSDFLSFLFSYTNLPISSYSFVLVHQCDNNGVPAILPFLIIAPVLHCFTHWRSFILPPQRAELGTGKTGFVICCQICFYGSKFSCIRLLTTNADLLRVPCNLFHSGFVPCVKPTSLSPSLRVFVVFLFICEASESHTSGVHML